MQLSFDPEQEVTDLTITIRRKRDGSSLFCAVVAANEKGTVLARWSKRGTKPRQEAGLADWARRVVQGYLYGDRVTVELAAQLGWLTDLPMLKAHETR
jgi:hypothetical protein